MSFGRIVIDAHLSLREFDETDAERLYVLTDGNRAYLRRFLPWVDALTDVSGSLKHIKRTKKQRLAGTDYVYGVFYDGKLIGDAAVMGVNKGLPEIGYWLAEEYSGRGIITSVVGALVRFSFTQLDLQKIHIRARPDNLASNRVAEKAGFVRDGTMVSDGEELNIWVLKKVDDISS